MKLRFFNTKKSNSDISEIQSNNLRDEILKNFEKMLPLPNGKLAIRYVFSCSDGRKGDAYAAKLGEEGDTVSYCGTKKNGYQISGISKQMETAEQMIKDHVLEIAENGIRSNCILTEWTIVAED